MFEGLLAYALDRLDSVLDYYDWEMAILKDYLAKEMPKYNFAFLADYLFHLIAKDELTDDEVKQKESLYEKLKSNLDLPDEQPEKEQGIVRYRIINKEQIVDKSICTDVGLGAKQYRKLMDMPTMLSFNALSLLVTRFEEFLSDYLEILFRNYSAKYIDKQTIMFEDIAELKCTEQIRDFLVQQEVEKQMRQDYKSLIKLLGNNHGMKFDNINGKLQELYEVSARRNIWVHNSGKVNSTYMGIVSNTQYNAGEYAMITCEYLTNTIQIMKTVIVAIMLESAKLVCKDDVAEYLSDIFDTAFDALQNKDYEFCIYVFGVLKELKDLPADQRLMAQVNYWIATIGLNGSDSVKAEIAKWDVSAYDKAFSLAKEVLLEHFTRATKLLESLYINGELSNLEITTWPLFEVFRQSKEYVEFTQKYAADFGAQTMKINEESDIAECITPEPENE